MVSYLDFPRCVLLDPNPEEGAKVVEEPHPASPTTLEELKSYIGEHQTPAIYPRLQWVNCKYIIIIVTMKTLIAHNDLYIIRYTANSPMY